MIPAEELAALQDAWNGICDQTMTVQRNTSLGVPNPDGSVPSTLSTIYTALPCVVDEPQGSYAQQLAAALVDQSVWHVAVPQVYQGVTIDVQARDIVTITTMNNLALTVQHSLNPNSYSLNNNFLASRPR